MRELLLDIHGDSAQPDSCVLVDTELDLVRALQSGSAPVLVRGKSLCRWACMLWAGRGWSARQLLSPVDELLFVCPGLTREQARHLLEIHGRAFALLPRPLTLQRVTEAVFPAEIWRQGPSVRHAARWLMWLDDNEPGEYARPLIMGWASQWRSIASEPEGRLYEAADAAQARELLAAWLGLSSGRMPELPIFPETVPAKYLDAAERRWLPEIIKTKGQYFGVIADLALPACMVETAAELACRYYIENPTDLSDECVRGLADYVLPSRLQSLRAILPPSVPAEVPQDADAIINWFRQQYLPYRQWAVQVNSEEGNTRTRGLCREFCSWYLSYYPSAIARGDERISYFRSAKEQGHPADDVVLLVILDGLNASDAVALVRYLRQNGNRLTPSADHLVFSPLPTVTEICKPAIVAGCAPRDASRAAPRPKVTMLPEGKDPTLHLEHAVAGSIFVWTLAEPDKTYHSKADRPVVQHNVDSALRSCGARIVEACNRIPTHLRLKVILTSDHGRLFGDSQRLHPVPAGMVSHQRAAIGRSATAFPATGFVCDAGNQVICVNGPRFGMSDRDDCAMVLSDAAFVTNDGKAGVEQFAHGGLFPEEVIVPWIELLRDAEAPAMSLKATGTAREGSEGRLTLDAVNSSRIALTVVSVDFGFGHRPPQRLVLEHDLPPLSRRSHVVALADWPSKREVVSGCATATIRPPAGPAFRIAVEMAIDSEGFYVQDTDILGDLS